MEDKELYTFADTAEGLGHAWDMTISLRRAGFKTRLKNRHVSHTNVVTVVAGRPIRPNRKERGCL
jgi:hypothetical protein